MDSMDIQNFDPTIPEHQEDNPYLELKELKSLRHELEQLMISNNIREQISGCLELEEAIHEFEIYLAGHISPEFMNKLKNLSQKNKAEVHNRKDAIELLLLGISLACTEQLYKIVINRPADIGDKSIAAVLSFLTFLCFLASAYKFANKEGFSRKELERLKMTFSRPKEQELVESLFNYLYLAWELDRTSLKFSASDRPEIKALSEKMKNMSSQQNEKIRELMKNVEELIKQPQRAKKEKERASLQVKTMGHMLEIIPLLQEAQKYIDTPLLTPEQLKMVN